MIDQSPSQRLIQVTHWIIYSLQQSQSVWQGEKKVWGRGHSRGRPPLSIAQETLSTGWDRGHPFLRLEQMNRLILPSSSITISLKGDRWIIKTTLNVETEHFLIIYSKMQTLWPWGERERERKSDVYEEQNLSKGLMMERTSSIN